MGNWGRKRNKNSFRHGQAVPPPSKMEAKTHNTPQCTLMQFMERSEKSCHRQFMIQSVKSCNKKSTQTSAFFIAKLSYFFVGATGVSGILTISLPAVSMPEMFAMSVGTTIFVLCPIARALSASKL